MFALPCRFTDSEDDSHKISAKNEQSTLTNGTDVIDFPKKSSSIKRKNNTQEEKISIPKDDDAAKTEDGKPSAGNNSQKNSLTATMFMLGIAYSANLGGTGFPTGTGPNLVLWGLLQR